MPAAERRQESGTAWPVPPLAVSCNWLGTGLVPGRESALAWAGGLLKASSR
jgi:hypothetical protein